MGISGVESESLLSALSSCTHSRGGLRSLCKETDQKNSVLLPDGPISDASSATTVYITDWEMSQVASPAYDLGQMFAELFELKHFKDIEAGVWLIEAFMQGYGKIDEEVAFKTAVHVGTHLICWGSRVQGWGTEEQVEGVVERGREWVVKAWEGDRGFFEGGPLGCLFYS